MKIHLKNCNVCGIPIYASKFAAKRFYCSSACKQRVYYGRHTEKSKAASKKWAEENRERSNEIKRSSRIKKRLILNTAAA
jgi:endogenous inhibitor of DNA gyrase (YacG/DUF329 family)